MKPKNEAQKQNAALEAFAMLVGTWRTTGTHPYMPGTTFHGEVTFEWIEGGAFLIMHSTIEEPGIPSGIAIFGSDNATKEYFMLYFDERGISRKYDVSVEKNIVRWWRDSFEFSQRTVLTISADGTTMESKGEMNKNNTTWEQDLGLRYTRKK